MHFVLFSASAKSSRIHFRHTHLNATSTKKKEKKNTIKKEYHRPAASLVSRARLVSGDFSALCSSHNLPVMLRINQEKSSSACCPHRRLNSAKPARLAQRRPLLALESCRSRALERPHSVLTGNFKDLPAALGSETRPCLRASPQRKDGFFSN